MFELLMLMTDVVSALASPTWVVSEVGDLDGAPIPPRPPK